MRFPPLKTLLKVLAFVLLSVVFTIGLAIKIGNLQLFAHNNSYSAVFADAAGVFKGDDVKLAGVNVGRVTGTRVENGHAVVDFTLSRDVKLRSDSIVAIRWRNVLGLRFLYVYPGSGQSRVLRDGAVVPLSQTEDAGDIGQFLDAVNTALGGSEVAVRQLLTDGATLAGQLGTKDKEIGDLVANSSKIMAAYASQSGNLGRILDDLDTLGGKLAGITGQVDSLITNFADVQSQLDHVLRASHGNIDSTLSSLDSVLGTLHLNKKELESTLCSIPLGVAPYYQTSSWGQWFNVRVTKITFKDNSGKTIVGQGEGQLARGSNQLRKVYTCGGAPVRTGHTPRSPVAATGLGGFLDFVTAKGGA